MKRMKRIVSMFLIMCLCVALAPVLSIQGNAASNPDVDSLYYINTSYGGYNKCIARNRSTGLVLPNCTGYVWGRIYELTGKTPDLSTNNAGTWYSWNKNKYDNGTGGYPYSSDITKPKAGAVAVWSKAGAAGHVAVVESVSGSSVTLSESGYSSSQYQNYPYYKFWYNRSATKSGNLGMSSSYSFLGYIYVPGGDSVAPQRALITADKLNYRVGETVKFTFDTDASPNCNVIWIYGPNGKNEYKTDLGSTYSRSFSVPGYYEATVTAWNGIGSKTSNRISFYVGEPQKSKISTDKYSYKEGETVKFTFDTDASPNCNVIWIYEPNGKSEYKTDLGTTYKRSFKVPGHYEATVTAWNGIGSKTSERVSFYVGEPQKSKISTDKYSYEEGETVKFTFDTDASPNCNVIWIYEPNGKSEYKTDLGTSYSKSFTAPGLYEATVTAWNGVGSKTSEKVKWSVGNRNISYDNNGGTGTIENQKKVYGKPIALSDSVLEREGYTFNTWNTKEDGSGTDYAPGDIYSEDADLTLYAQWTPISYVVKYDANGGEGSMSDTSCTYDTPTSLRANTFKKDGCFFRGWNTKADGSGTTFADNATVKNLSSKNSEDVMLYAQWEKDLTTCIGYTLSFNGNIAMNFYMELSDKAVADEGAYMKFTLPGANHTAEKVMVSEAKKVKISGKACYIFSAGVAAKNMTDDITAQFIMSDGTTSKEYTYDIRQYADYIINHPKEYSTEAIDMVKAMLNYGGYTQVYFGYNTDNLANADIDNTLSKVDLDDSYNYVTEESCDGVKYTGTRLSLQTNTVIKHYFTVTGDIGEYTFTCEGKILTPVKTGNMYYVEISGIPAKELGKAYELDVTKEDAGTIQLYYGVYTNIQQVLASSNYDNAAKNMMKALYWFGEATKAYFASKS